MPRTTENQRRQSRARLADNATTRDAWSAGDDFIARNRLDGADTATEVATTTGTVVTVNEISILPFHQLADLFPLMEGEEFDEFVGDVRRRGLRFPITVFDGQIIDGRNRARACQEAGKQPTFVTFEGVAEDVPRFIISANIHRRHLKPEQRRDLIKRLLNMNPEQSDRTIATLTKTSPTTVGAVRRSTVQSGQLKKRVGRDGKARKQPKSAGSSARRNGGAANRDPDVVGGVGGRNSGEEVAEPGDSQQTIDTRVVIARLGEIIRHCREGSEYVTRSGIDPELAAEVARQLAEAAQSWREFSSLLSDGSEPPATPALTWKRRGNVRWTEIKDVPDWRGYEVAKLNSPTEPDEWRAMRFKGRADGPGAHALGTMPTADEAEAVCASDYAELLAAAQRLEARGDDA
jgi:hypothetical protein